MATLFSLNNGNFTDYNTLGFSLTSAEIKNNTTGISIPSNKACCVPFAENSRPYTLSAISVHLSAIAESPIGTFDLVINKYNKNTFNRTTVVQNYPLSEFTTYDGTNNFSNTYPSNWHTLNLSTPITVLSSETILLCLSTSDENQLSLMGTKTFVNRAGFNTPTLFGTLSTSIDNLPYSYFSDSLHFGTTNYYTFPANSRYALNGDFTIEFWINTSTYNLDTNNRRVFGASAIYTIANLEILFLPTSNAIKVQTNNITRIDGNIAVANGSWHHIAVTRNASNIKLFVDGAQSGSTYSSTTNFSAGSASGITIGKYGGATTGRFQGYLSNIHIVNGTSLYNSNFTLTPTVLEPVPTSNTVLLLKSGVQIDKALVTSNSTLTGSITEAGTITRSASGTTLLGSISGGGGGQSFLTFNESTSPYTIIPKTGDYTFEVLFYASSIPSNPANRSVLLYPICHMNNSIYIGADYTYNRIIIDVGDYYNLYSPTYDTTFTFLSSWTHVAVVVHNRVLSLYVNGFLRNQRIIDPQINTTNQEFVHGLNIGKEATNYYHTYFNGTISYISSVKYAKYTNNFTPNLDPTQVVPQSLYQSFLYTQSTSGYYTASYAPSSTLVKDDYHINHNLLLDSSPAANNMYIHKNGTLTFSPDRSNTLLVTGPDGVQVTQEGTLNIGTELNPTPLSTTHTIVLSSNYIDVHNAGNLNIYGASKQLYTSLTNDVNASNSTFAITDVVSSTWKAGDQLVMIPNTTQKLNFDSLTLGGFTNSNTLTTTSPSLYDHLGVGSNPYVPSIYNITRNVVLSSYENTKFNMKFLGSAKVSINNTVFNKMGDFGIKSVLDNNGYSKINSNIIRNTQTQEILTSDDPTAYSTKFESKQFATTTPNATNIHNTNATLEFNILHVGGTTGKICAKQVASTTAHSSDSYTIDVIAGDKIQFTWYKQRTTNESLVGGTLQTKKLKLNVWNNIVLTHNYSTNTAKLYLNGKLNAQGNVGGWWLRTDVFLPETSLYWKQPTFTIGCRGRQTLTGVAYDQSYNGSQSYINNLRITKSILYTSDFNPTFEKLSVVPNTKLLVFQNEIISDASKTCTITPNTFITYNTNPNRNFTNVLFENNIIINSLYNSLKFVGARFNKCYITNNIILSSGLYALNFSDSYGDYILSGNKIISNKSGGLISDLYSINFDSISNIVYNCSGNGFNVSSIEESLFKDNIAAYNQGVGFYINDLNEDIPTGTIIGLSSLYNKGIGFYNVTPTVDVSVINAKLLYNTQSGLVGQFSNNSILSGIESKFNSIDGIYINTLSANNGLSGLQIYDSTITNNLSYGLRLSAVTINPYYSLTANNLLLSSNGINGLHLPFGDTCLLTNINSLCNNANGIFLGPNRNSIFNSLTGSYNKIDGLSLTISATDFILQYSTFSYNLSNGINLSGMDMLNSNIELHECILSANKVNGLNSTVLSANHLNINSSIISNNVIGYSLSSNYVDSIQIQNSTLNRNSVGFLLSGTNTNYLNPTDIVFSNLTVENNTNNGIEIYNIRGSISSVRLYNNLTNGIITSLGNGLMVFDGISGYATGTRNIINVISARNYNQTIIKNSLLSCIDVLNTVNLIRINADKLEEFRLENSILSSTNPITFTTSRPKLEGSFMFHNCNSDKYNLSAIAVTQYQSDVFTETGISVMKENNIDRNHYKWLPAGKISFDSTFGYDLNTFSEKLEPASSTLKLRSSSKLIPLLKNEIISVSVYVYKSASYSGSAPRLILKNNSSIGFSETVLTTSNGVNESWELLAATLPMTTNDGVAEIYIDCSGPIGSGSINIDSWNF